jgi:hypothetical protein
MESMQCDPENISNDDLQIMLADAVRVVEKQEFSSASGTLLANTILRIENLIKETNKYPSGVVPPVVDVYSSLLLIEQFKRWGFLEVIEKPTVKNLVDGEINLSISISSVEDWDLTKFDQVVVLAYSLEATQIEVIERLVELIEKSKSSFELTTGPQKPYLSRAMHLN